MPPLRWISSSEDNLGKMKTGGKLTYEVIGNAMAAAPFFFQILLSGWKDALSGTVNQSIVVEVSPTTVPGAVSSGDKAKTEREVAEGLARRVALEILQSQSGSAAEVIDAIAQIGSLPDEIGEKPPMVQRAGVRAWLL
jgi:hypothetical protein